MQYRKFGKCGFDVSVLGFGCMRLPLTDGTTNPIFVEQDTANIDEVEAIRMIRYAIDAGVNYLDTAYNYHKKNSEILVGKALQDGYRAKVKLATKSPVWLAKTYEDFERLLTEQLEKLQTDYIDLYLLHALNHETWPIARDLGVLKFIDQVLADGRVKHIGFSFHDGFDIFKEIVDAYNWDFCQIQLNYFDVHNQAGVEGMRYAAEKGLAVIAMEPLRGGQLVNNIPAEVQEIWDSAPVHRTPVEWALHWVWNHPEISLLLSGMGTMEQVKDNLRIADEAKANSLTSEELALYEQAKNLYMQRASVPCTSCGYCGECPNKVLITDIFYMYNEASLFNQTPRFRQFYQQMIKIKRDFSACVECGHCETICPQQLPVTKYLKEAHEFATSQS